MRTITQTVNIFKFNELSLSAKEKAKQDYASAFGYDSATAFMFSIEALAEHFGGVLKRYEIDWFDATPCSPPVFEMPEMEPEEIRERLENLGEYNPETLKGLGDCKLTGFFADECAIDGFRKAWYEGERDLTKLMLAAYKTWLRAAHNDCESQYFDEVFEETCEANGWEFLENGQFYS